MEYKSGDCVDIKMLSYWHWYSHCKYKMVMRPSFLIMEIPYQESLSLYWNKTQDFHWQLQKFWFRLETQYICNGKHILIRNKYDSLVNILIIYIICLRLHLLIHTYSTFQPLVIPLCMSELYHYLFRWLDDGTYLVPSHTVWVFGCLCTRSMGFILPDAQRAFQNHLLACKFEKS